MTNPYSVLGVSPQSSDEEIKNAYRELARRYSSESESDTDPLQSVADARMQELNEAYDQIMAQRRTGGNQADQFSDSSHETPPHSYTSRSRYSDVRQYLRAGNLLAAEQQLTAVSPSERDAEWNFLMGYVCQGRGWLDDAHRYYGAACSMDPSNPEYAAAYNRMNEQRRAGGTGYSPYGQPAQNSGGCMNDDACNTACQCLCLYQLCSSCCCGGR